VDEILFLRAARPWARSAIMGMKMRRPIHNGILQGHMSLQPLMQVPCLCNVDGRPITIRQFASINVNPGQGTEGSVQRINREGILLAALPGPIVGRGRGGIRVRVATE